MSALFLILSGGLQNGVYPSRLRHFHFRSLFSLLRLNNGNELSLANRILKAKADERLKSNLNKAARNGFLASIICIVGLAFVINTQPAPDMLIIALEASFWIMVIVFAASFTLFDRMGIS